MHPNDAPPTIAKEPSGLPTKCRPCWWREGRACFSEAFGPVPKVVQTFTDSCGDEQSYNRNVGHEITDEHFISCQNTGAMKTRAAVWNHVASLFGAKVTR